MSKNIMNHFTSLLLGGNFQDLTIKYYAENVRVILNEHIKSKEKTYGLNLLQQTLAYIQILQFKVVDIKQVENEFSYAIYLVTKNRDNTIDFSEHHIVNRWRENRIYYHEHYIINH